MQNNRSNESNESNESGRNGQGHRNNRNNPNNPNNPNCQGHPSPKAASAGDAATLASRLCKKFGTMDVVLEDYVMDVRINPGRNSFVKLGDDYHQVEAMVPQKLTWKLVKMNLRSGMGVRIEGIVTLDERRVQPRLRVTSLGWSRALRTLEAPAWHREVESLRAAQQALDIPAVPSDLVVIGPPGDGLNDFRAIVKERNLSADIEYVEIPSVPERIASSLAKVGARTNRPDALFIVRGGGANICSAFNSEPVVRAIASCPVPVLLAVGHANDRPIAARVARLEHKTPTDAALWLAQRHEKAARTVRERSHEVPALAAVISVEARPGPVGEVLGDATRKHAAEQVPTGAATVRAPRGVSGRMRAWWYALASKLHSRSHARSDVIVLDATRGPRSLGCPSDPPVTRSSSRTRWTRG